MKTIMPISRLIILNGPSSAGKSSQETMPHALTSLVRHGHNVVFDTVSIGDHFQILQENLKSFNPFYVGVTAPLQTLQQREIDRGDRQIGLTETQFEIVHKDIVYDFTVDTEQLTPDQAATAIIKARNLCL